VQSDDAEAESIDVDSGANNNDQEDNCLNLNLSVSDERRQGAPYSRDEEELVQSIDAEAESIDEIERSIDADPKSESNDSTGSPFSASICLSGSTCLPFDRALEVYQGPDIFNVGMFGAIKTNQQFHSNLFKSRLFCGLEIVTESKLL
jgi:hypothetical protein